MLAFLQTSRVRPPRRNQCNQLAGTGATVVIIVPADWLRKTVRFKAVGEDFWLQCAEDASISITTTQVNTVVSNVFAAHAAIGAKVPAGQYEEYYFEPEDRYFGFKGAATGYLEFRVA